MRKPTEFSGESPLFLLSVLVMCPPTGPIERLVQQYRFRLSRCAIPTRIGPAFNLAGDGFTETIFDTVVDLATDVFIANLKLSYTLLLTHPYFVTGNECILSFSVCRWRGKLLVIYVRISPSYRCFLEAVAASNSGIYDSVRFR